MIFQFPLDDQIVCFDDSSRQLSVANPVGARILHLHTSGLDQSAIVDRLFDEFEARREQIENDVRVLVQQWDAGELPSFRPTQTHEPDTDYAPHRPLQPVDQLLIHLPSATITVHSESAAVVAQLQSFSRLGESVVQTDISLRVDIFEDNGRFPIVYNGQTLDTGISIENTALVCLRALNVLVSFIESHAFTLHAAAVARDNKGILLTARGGSGKTTLTAYLISHGHQLINDDAVHVAADPMNMVPIPIAMSIKEGSWDILAQWFDHLPQQTAFGLPGSQQRYLPPDDVQVCTHAVPCSIVCFPCYRAHADTELVAIDRPTALSRLMQSGCYLPTPIEPAHIERLVSWAQHLDFYSLTYSSVEEAEGVIRELIS